MALTFAADTKEALPLYFIAQADLGATLAALPTDQANFATGSGFKAGAGQVCLLAGDDGQVAGALAGAGSAADVARQRFVLGAARAKLPAATFRLECDLNGDALDEAALGWLLAGYRFDKFRSPQSALAELIAPEGVQADRLECVAAGEALTRDLINRPANDLGPSALQSAFFDLAALHGATARAVVADDLLAQNFAMIHTVGRASADAPRLLEMTWGTSGPLLTLVGKGVCFDSGGLNIKPGASMGLMKKDMGGGATVLGLAHMIMASDLPIRLQILVPAVENAISGSAFRPGDILPSRKGLSIEINNTDAEGRLVLGDALALADEGKPDLIVSMATLTGAARVAVGPDLAPFYAQSDQDAQHIQAGARAARDPVWRMPFWDPYEPMIEPGIADLDNAPKGGFAGSITAALFLRRFVTNCPRYVHFDIYGWNPTAAPARPKGGVGQGARALFQALPDLLKL